MGSNTLISVLTPTYNRGNTLHRVYDSLCRSRYKNFEWVVVNDGSTDDTDEVMNRFIKQADFTIRYYSQENRGKHIAMNKLYSLALGEYSFQLDSDDEVLPTAMEDALEIWNSLNNRDVYWCVTGRCIDHDTKQVVGEPFPANINSLSGKRQNKLLATIGGEKWGLQRTGVVRQFPFPDKPDMYFCTEDYIWIQINAKYQQYYTNKVFRVYYASQDIAQLSRRSKTEKRFKNDCVMYKLYLNNIFGKGISLPFKRFLIVTGAYLKNSILAGKRLSETIGEIDPFWIRFTLLCGYLPSWLALKVLKPGAR